MSTFLKQGHGCTQTADCPGSQCKKYKTRPTVTRGANQSELQYKLVYANHTKEWATTPIMQITSRDYPNPILDAIVDRKSQKPRERSATHAPPHIPKKINLVVRQIGAKI